MLSESLLSATTTLSKDMFESPKPLKEFDCFIHSAQHKIPWILLLSLII